MTSQLANSNVAWERRGTISVDNGSSTIVGDATFFQLTVASRDQLFIDGIDVPFEIDEVVSDTELTIVETWNEASISNVNYKIVRGYTWNLASNIAALQGELLQKWQGLQSVYMGQTPPEKGNEGDAFFNITDPDNISLSLFSLGVWGIEQTLRGQQGLGWLFGSGPPNPSDGRDGEAYLDITNEVVYGPKTNGAWANSFSIKGSPGLNTLAGEGPPQPNLGLVGETYRDVPQNLIYGPKTVEGWGNPVSYKGTIGDIGPRGEPFQIDAQGLSTGRATYDNEDAGFVYYETDNQQAFQRIGGAGQWVGPIIFGAQKQNFFGFNINSKNELIVETGEGDFDVADYLTWTICAGPCSYSLDNGELKLLI